jgi:two-component sensor histidine kinase/PAS domain-containing protein
MTEGTAPEIRNEGPARNPPGARTSLRQVLWGLVLALALPAILVAAGGLYSGYLAERQATDMRLQEITRALASSLDREIEKSEVALRVLALSPSIRSGDFAAFHRQASEAGVANPFWVALIEPGGRIVLNTRVPYGDFQPDSTRLEVLRRIQETRRAELSDLYVGPVTGQSLVTLDVPVIVNNQVAYILSAAIGQEVFQQLIRDQRIAETWNAAVLDRSGRIVARSRSPEQFVGQFARPGVRDAIAASPEGNVRSVTLEGIPVQTYFSRSPAYGWSFVISRPAAELVESLRRPLFWLLILTAVLLAGILLAAVLSRLIARPIHHLVGAAQALGRGEAIAGPTTGVREFDTIQKALAEAAESIRRQERVRDEVLERIADGEARLHLALDVGDLGSWEYIPATGAYISSPTCRTNYGRRPDEPLTYDELVASIHPDDRQKQAEVVAKALANRTDLQLEYRVIWPDGSEHWLRVGGRTRIGPDGLLSLVGFSQNVTERRLADERQALLLHELNHRVKNTLATVQSVASLTRRSAERGDPGAWDAFLGRLQGLAKTHDLLTAAHWKGALLEDVLRSELDPYQDPMRQRIRLRGPDIDLQPSAVLALSLAIHELATNATKYGSLSVAEGRISVMWAITGGTTPLLLVEWLESGGPPVKPPERQGFGTKLIQRGLAQQLGGEIKLDFAPAGVRCVITFPVQSVVLNLEEVGESQERFAS